MINDSNKTEIIDLYLSGEMDAELLKEFEAKLNQEEDFRNEVALQRAITKNIKKAGKEDFRKMLKSIHFEMVQNGEESELDVLSVEENERLETEKSEGKIHNIRNSSTKRYFLYIAASVVFFILVGLGVLYTSVNRESLSSQQLALYEVSSTRNGETDQEQEILRSYRRGDYQSTINSYEDISQPTLEDMFLAGNAFLATSDYEKAQQTFNELISLNQKLPLEEQRFNEDAEYYLGLSYLKNNEINKAEEIFTNIDNRPDHLYNEKVNKWFLLKIKILKFKSS